MRPILLLLAASMASLVLACAAAAIVDQATIIVNKGAGGVTLGMTRAQVVAVLGKPLYENSYGYMQYSSKNLFDVYRSGSRTGRVDMLGISGPRFCLRNGICMLRRNNVAALKQKFGKRLTFHKLSDGTLFYRVSGSFQGRRSYTEFDVDGPNRPARIIMIWVAWKR
ncbi:MAG: hypothetical protein ABSC51_09075 [Gaiellaceae bacterium]|jgi:hypothetical protein